MPRRAATRPAFALAVLVVACAPTGDREPLPGLVPAKGSPAFVRPSRGVEAPAFALASAPVEDVCGAIVIEPTGSWVLEGVQLDGVRDHWQSSMEYGQPVAIREARPPFEVPGHRFWQVQVERAPRPIQPCFTKDGSPPQLLLEGCVDVWALIGEATPEARPRTAEQWAQLLGLLDGASAVYPDEGALERCVEHLPSQVRPSLGLRRSGTELHVTFVERVDFGPELTMLVTVHATLEDDRLGLEHEELWAINRGVAR
jgi:hypothetical protein